MTVPAVPYSIRQLLAEYEAGVWGISFTPLLIFSLLPYHTHIPPPHAHTHPTPYTDAVCNPYHSFPSSGSVGRSATFCVLCSILECMKWERVVDTFTTVHTMRARLLRTVCSTVSVGLSWGLLYGPARCMCRAFGALSTEVFCACCAPMTTCVPTGTDNMLVCYRKCVHSGTWRTATLQHQHKHI